MPKKTTNSKGYSATLTLKDGTVYKGKGKSTVETLDSITLKELALSAGMFSITHEDKKIEKLLSVLKINRLFGGGKGKKLATLGYSKYLDTGL